MRSSALSWRRSTRRRAARSGVWSLPDGEARYAYLVKAAPPPSLTPEEIHQLGLREVARIEGEMLAIAKQLGFHDLKAFNLAQEEPGGQGDVGRPDSRPLPPLHRSDACQAADAVRPDAEGQARGAATEYYRAAKASGADYIQGTPDGSRPGHVYVNTSEATTRKRPSALEITAYHEGIPGHHLQLSIQQELPALPPFRQQGGKTAYVEGWALYSERLGKEVGFFQDPYSDYGHLKDEMLRAIRLVVDTGLHEKKWTREQVVQFFHDHSAIDEADVQTKPTATSPGRAGAGLQDRTAEDPRAARAGSQKGSARNSTFAPFTTKSSAPEHRPWNCSTPACGRGCSVRKRAEGPGARRCSPRSGGSSSRRLRSVRARCGRRTRG